MRTSTHAMGLRSALTSGKQKKKSDVDRWSTACNYFVRVGVGLATGNCRHVLVALAIPNSLDPIPTGELPAVLETGFVPKAQFGIISNLVLYSTPSSHHV